MKFQWRKIIYCGHPPDYSYELHLQLKPNEKVVFEFPVFNEIIKKRAEKVAWRFSGVTSVDFVEGNRQLKVTGRFGQFEMMKKLRKVDKRVSIIEATKVGQKKKEVNKPSEPQAPRQQAPIDKNKPSDAYWYDVVKGIGARVGGQFNRENAAKIIDMGRNFVGYFRKEDKSKQKRSNFEHLKNHPRRDMKHPNGPNGIDGKNANNRKP